MLDAGALKHRNNALAIGAVSKDQDFASGRNSSGKHGLDAEGAAALQEDGFEAGFPRKAGQPEDSVPHAGYNRIESKMPGTGVAQHGLLNG